MFALASRFLGLFGAFLLGIAFASPVRADYTNLLLGKPPLHAQGVQRPEAVSDGRAAPEGGSWKTLRTSVFHDTHSFIEFDLGSVREIRAAWLSGDHNDTYRVEVSQDGQTYTLLWDAPAVDSGGMAARSIEGLSATGRYVRVRPLRGDGMFSVSELQVFGGQGGALPEPQRVSAPNLDRRMRDQTLSFALLLMLALLLPARTRWWARLAALGVAAWGTYLLARGVWNAWPVSDRGVSLLRGIVATVGAAAVAREAFAPRRWPASPAAVGGVLGLSAVLGFLAFYNLGHPQFYNAHTGTWSFAHHLDLRQYYPTAKYFRELSYTGIYDADLAAYAELEPGSLEQLAAYPVRDLESLEQVSVADRAREISTVRQRFSPERWAEYRRDADWFRRSMGDKLYLETLIDYGGNATPTWIAIAHVLFTWLPPSDAAFTWLGLIDPVLLAVMFCVMLRTFGWRATLVCALVFGANDFVMYGTNWGGAALRHDWLAYLGLGACALRRERWVLGGALLGLAAMIRAFPALALLGIGIPAALRTVEQVVRERRWPRLAELWRTEHATLRIALGAIGVALAAALLSTLVLGAGAWTDWIDKVGKIESDPHPASVALRNLIAGDIDQVRVLHARWPVYAAAIVGFLAAAVLVSRHARIEQAAVLGLCLVPVVLYPANYYLHMVFLWPLLAAGTPTIGRRDAVLWFILLGMCAAQYFTTLVDDLRLHFYLSTACLFVALTGLFGALLERDPSVRGWFARER